ncbi:MAG: competence protein CoiA family protein [Alkaliphilus sp.]
MTVNLEFGLRRGNMYHVSDVENGLECDCVCPSCKVTLVAKKGNERTHHFAHHRAMTCSSGAETALVLFVKQLLKKEKQLTLPPMYSGRVDPKSGNKETFKVIKGLTVQFDEVTEGEKIGEYKPSLIATKKERKLLIEIIVRNKTSSSKLGRIIKSNLSCIEINLKDYHRNGLNCEDLKNEIMNKVKNKKWLINKRYETEVQKKEREMEDDFQKRAEIFYKLRHELTRDRHRFSK